MIILKDGLFQFFYKYGRVQGNCGSVLYSSCSGIYQPQ